MKQIISFDFETYYDTGCSLSSLSYTDYIFHHDFKVHGAAYVTENGCGWLSHEEVPGFLEKHKEHIFLFQNAQFDVSVMLFIYNFMPVFILDTLLMARLKDGFLLDHLDLGTLAEAYSVGSKGDAIEKFKGIRHLEGDLLESVKEYAINDAHITRSIYNLMKPALLDLIGPVALKRELRVIDATIKLIEPKLFLDRGMLERGLASDLFAQQEALRGTASFVGLPVEQLLKTLRSRKAFPELLARLGVVAPKKISKTTGKETFAFAKSDDKFIKLIEAYEGTPIGDVLTLKRDASSTIHMTRAQRFINVADQCGNKLPIYLNFAGAQQTLRLSGGNRMNAQNLPRKSVLRDAIHAPEGHKLIIADFSAVEARVLAWLAGDENTLDLFRNDVDVYVEAVRPLWGDISGENGKPDSTKRFVGKCQILSLGYGAGWTALESVLRLGGLGQEFIFQPEQARTVVEDCHGVKEKLRKMHTENRDKFDGYSFLLQRNPSLLWHFAASERLVSTYRGAHPEITRLWKESDPKRLMACARGSIGQHVFFDVKGDLLTLTLPGSTKLLYNKIRISEESGNVSYRLGGIPKYTYGGKIVENITQAVARNLMVEAWVNCIDNGFTPVWSVHDELVFIVPEEDALYACMKIENIMTHVPVWASGLPIGAKVGVADNYSEK